MQQVQKATVFVYFCFNIQISLLALAVLASTLELIDKIQLIKMDF